VQKTSPDEASGRNGVGLYVLGADLTVTSAVVRESTTSGLLLFKAQVRLRKTLVESVSGGRFDLATGEKFEGIGDGILSLANSVTDLTDVQVTDCSRVGVLYDSSTGKLERTSATNNQIGLVLQGSPQPTFSEDCTFEGNTETNMVLGGEIPVPDLPISLP
jgi:nitrous oxidase accessory protein NosD